MYSAPSAPAPTRSASTARSGRHQQAGPLTPPPSPPAHLSASQQQKEQQQKGQQQRYHSPPQRGSFSPYDDPHHPQSSNSPPSRVRHPSDGRRLSGNGVGGPKQPPLPVGPPMTVEHDLVQQRRLSSASAGSRRASRNTQLSMELTAGSPTTSSNRNSTYSFLDGPPPNRRDSRRISQNLEPVDESARRPSLLPRSAVRTDDCFGLDFSFLDDEPPPRPNFSSTRRIVSEGGPFGRSSPSSAFPSAITRRLSAGSEKSLMSSRFRDSDLEPPRSPARSFGSVQSLPFPSRPKTPRTASTDSIPLAEHERRQQLPSTYNPGTFVPGTFLGPPVDDTRRPSVVSSVSMESTDSSALSNSYGGLMPSDLESPTDSNFSIKSQQDRGPDDLEKRKRLAAFLDQTAEAMEGGRSLAMVLPEARATESEPGKSMSELAEATASPRLAPLIEYRHPFTSPFNSPAVVPADSEEGNRSPRNNSRVGFSSDSTNGFGPGSSPGTPTPAPIARNHSPVDPAMLDNRRTVYFTPDPNSSSSDEEENESSGSDPQRGDDEREDDEEEEERAQPSRKLSGGGLGFNIDIKTQSNLTNARPSAADRSPSTLRASSPASSREFVAPSTAEPLPVISVEAAREMEKRAKVAEKRKRTIQELIDTEASYATDMVVVRDIYLARAKGVDIGTIADRVMDSGLGLGKSAASPPSPLRGGNNLTASFYAAGQSPAASRADLRRSSLAPNEMRRPSAVLSFSAKLEQRRATLAAGRIEAAAPSQALMSTKDLHIVFANLEEVAGLAETFARVLEGAKGGDDADEMDDRIGEVFVQMISRIEKIYSAYCSRHDRAIVRLQELEPTLRGYFAECKTLSHGRTGAWDLGSLLIKPVQRCLKYPLLLDQILAVTPEDHPDRLYLQRANEKMLGVAEHINEQKQRHRQVERLTPKKDLNARRDSTRSIGSAVTKKFLRASTPKPSKSAMGDCGERDDMFDTLAHLVDSTRSAVLRFSNEMRDWSRTTKAGLEAQVTMVDGWIGMYAPLADDSESSLYSRLCIFLEEVLDPIIDGPWRELDHEIRRSLLLKTDHLLSLFESPRQFIAKRNDKMLEHSRYLAKKLPADRRGSEEFVDLSTRLLEELPRFLGSVSRYYDIIVGHFGGAQEAYHEAVQERWDAFAEQFEQQSQNYRDLLSSQHQSSAEMMSRLAAGLGVAVTSSAVNSPAARKRLSRLSGVSHGSAASSPFPQRQTIPPPVEDRRHSTRLAPTVDCYLPPPTSNGNRANRNSLATNRSSVTSDSSTPSFALSSNGGGSSSGAPTTPPPLTGSSPNGYLKSPPRNPSQRHSLGALIGHGHPPTSSTLDHRRHSSLAARYEAPLPSVPIHEVEASFSESGDSSSAGPSPSVVTFREPARSSDEGEGPYESSGLDVPRPRPTMDRAMPSSGGSSSEAESKYLSTYSVYVEAGEGFDSSDQEDEEGEGYGEKLYTAEAMRDTTAPMAYRSGFPILSFKMGDRIDVELEEADRAEGGAGWLLGRTVDGVVGWARTEDFHLLGDDEE